MIFHMGDQITGHNLSLVLLWKCSPSSETELMFKQLTTRSEIGTIQNGLSRIGTTFSLSFCNAYQKWWYKEAVFLPLPLSILDANTWSKNLFIKNQNAEFASILFLQYCHSLDHSKYRGQIQLCKAWLSLGCPPVRVVSISTRTPR